MIKKIGIKRTILLVVLLAMAGLLGVNNEYVLKPQTRKSQQELNTAQGEIGRLQGEIEKMQTELDAFELQKNLYQTITRMGFFSAQDRVLARERFNTMQKLSKIISARYEIKSATILPDMTPTDPNAMTAAVPEGAESENPSDNLVVLESPIDVSLSAIDDIDIYRFIYYLNYGFPGHITIDELSIERMSEVTPEILRAIGSGTPPEIISAKMSLKWRTMSPKNALTSQNTSAMPEPGSPGAPAQAGTTP